AGTIMDNGVGVGECKKGTQVCGDDMKYGGCDGEQRPKQEDCTNPGHDDDCDGETDEETGEGETCDTASSGACKTGTKMCEGGALMCIAPEAKTETCNGADDDCDGYVDNGFHLNSDNNNCGKCGVKCSAGATCCGGTCTDVMGDSNNCGVCGNHCG